MHVSSVVPGICFDVNISNSVRSHAQKLNHLVWYYTLHFYIDNNSKMGWTNVQLLFSSVQSVTQPIQHNCTFWTSSEEHFVNYHLFSFLFFVYHNFMRKHCLISSHYLHWLPGSQPEILMFHIFCIYVKCMGVSENILGMDTRFCPHTLLNPMIHISYIYWPHQWCSLHFDTFHNNSGGKVFYLGIWYF